MKCYRLALIIIFSLFQLVFAEDTMENFSLQRMDGENLRWDLHADIARFKEKQTDLEGVELKFCPEDKAPFTIEAEKGRVGKNREEVFLENQVLIKGYSGTDLCTEDLSWDSKSNIFLTSKKVIVEKDAWVIRGKGMKFDPEQEILIINGGVEMKIGEKFVDREIM